MTKRGIALVLAGLTLLSCSSSNDGETSASQTPVAVGSPCVLAYEFCADFGGASESFTLPDMNSPMCGGQICMAKHFRGRSTCPFGNPAGGSQYTGADAECNLPGSSTPVTEAVQPQCATRTNQVYCTCECAGSDPNGDYCLCPRAFSCQLVAANGGPGISLCVREDDIVGDGYTCPQGMKCDEVADHCGYTSNTVPAPGTAACK